MGTQRGVLRPALGETRKMIRKGFLTEVIADPSYSKTHLLVHIATALKLGSVLQDRDTVAMGQARCHDIIFIACTGANLVILSSIHLTNL